MKRTGGQAVVRALEEEGVSLAFGIPGTHNIELYDALAGSDDVRTVLVTDERSAAFMADGAWRASGRLACVNLVPGAGLTHALSGIAEAFLDNVPMLVLACGVRTDVDRPFQLHDVHQRAIAAPVTKEVLRADRGEEIHGLVRRACRLARSGAPGPVMVEIPAQHYLFRHEERHEPGGRETEGGARAAAGAGGSEPEAPEGPRAEDALQERPGPERAVVEEAVRILEGARRPLLYVGLGAAGAGGRLVELAERLETPVSTTFQGKGVFPETHPLWLWPGFGRTAPPFVRGIAERCDACLAIGCRFREVGTGSWSFTPPSPLVHVDIDPDALERHYDTELAAAADASLFVEALLERLEPRGEDLDLRAEIREGHREVREEQLRSDGEGVTPARLLRAIQERLGPETVFTADSGNGTFLALEGLRLDAPGRFLAPIDYSCMGYAVPAAVGASLALPAAPVVALPGDGAFLMTGLELLTAAREGAAVAVFLLRDRELAQIAQFQELAFGRRTASEVPDYDLDGLARSLGVESLRLDEDDEVDATVERVAAIVGEGRPVAVDTAIDYSHETWFTRGVVRTTVGRLPWRERLRFIGRALLRRLTG